MFWLQIRLRHIKAKLRIWNQEVFGNIFEDKQDLEDQMTLIHNNWIKGGISQSPLTRRVNSYKNGMIDAIRKKLCGDKNPVFNG